MKNCSVILLFLLMAGFAPAIVVQNYSVATNAPTGDWDLNWDYVYNYKQSSAVAVGEYWILTAAHVADDGGTGALAVNGVIYYQQEVIFHNTADLALVRFDKPFPGFYSLHAGEIYTGAGRSKTYRELILVGFGFDGVASSSSFTQGSYRGIKRWGTNKGEAEATIPGDIVGDDGVPDVSTSCFRMDFNLGESAYEAGANIYDSGGPVFIDNGSEWVLTGIILYRNGDNPYTGNYAAMVPDYSAWIESTMSSVTGDADGDGIPTWWEEQFATNIVADADQDGDGFDGEAEYIADTDPTDSNSFFRIEGTITAADQTFTLDGSAARQYQLLYTTNDLAATHLVWSTNGVPIWGEGADTQITVTNTEDKVFYRLEAILP
jgi:hypothetical protein